MTDYRVLIGDCLETLKTLPEQSVHTCVTSPPYFGLRDYGVEGQLGAEPTPDEFVEALVRVFREVWRVLRDDGTVWLNLGDSYANYGSGSRSEQSIGHDNERYSGVFNRKQHLGGLKYKDLIGIPWRVAFALQQDGWYLRQDIIWHKPNPMPESVRDRCTKAHEYVFLMAKSERYYYDQAAINEPAVKAGQVLHAYGTAAKDRQDVSDVNDRRTRIGLANWDKACP
ncbi:DNA methyltransferase, partial [uncultured Halomonas sp.]|uniref:DNA-methyltransferase n=1 Tax=uncultured Halomonas sp. TaxID=173971 RepID=UPI002634C885